MSKTSYYEKENIKKILQTKELRKELPIFANEFFIGIESVTTAQTRLNYARDLVEFFKFLSEEIFFKDVKQILISDLDTLDVSQIEIYIDYLTTFERNGQVQTNSLSSKKRKLSTIRSFFKYFFNKNKLKANVAAKVPLPKLRENVITRLNQDESNAVLQAAENISTPSMSKRQRKYNEHTISRDIAILTMFLGTGLRISELVGLNVSDVDFKNKALKITRKGGYESIVYFSNEVLYALGDYMQEREKYNKHNDDDNALFLSLQGTRLTPRSIQMMVKKFTQSVVPLKHITPHKLRSTYGTNLYNETRDIFVVAEVLGHKDVNTTKKFYAASSEAIKKEASDKVKIRQFDNDDDNNIMNSTSFNFSSLDNL